jgi:hypothetical protein
MASMKIDRNKFDSSVPADKSRLCASVSSYEESRNFPAGYLLAAKSLVTAQQAIASRVKPPVFLRQSLVATLEPSPQYRCAEMPL